MSFRGLMLHALVLGSEMSGPTATNLTLQSVAQRDAAAALAAGWSSGGGDVDMAEAMARGGQGRSSPEAVQAQEAVQAGGRHAPAAF